MEVKVTATSATDFRFGLGWTLGMAMCLARLTHLGTTSPFSLSRIFS